MKKLHFAYLLAFLFIPGACLQADPVTLTDTQGRSIQATIVTVAAGTATVTLENGRQFRIPESNLNEESIKVLENWKLAQLSKQPRAPFNISIRSFTENKEVDSSQSTRLTTYNEGYIVTVENATPMMLPALKVEYILLKEGAVLAAASSKDVVKNELKGEAELEPMGMRGKSEFQTKTVEIRESRLKSGWSYMSGGKANAIDELAGICIRITSGDQLIYEFARPPSLLGKVSWD